MMLFRCVLLLCTLMHMCECGRVLVVFPVPGRSHTTPGDAVVRSLLKGGHHVTYVTTWTTLKSEHLKVINVTPEGDHYHPDGDLLSLFELLQNSMPSQHELTTGTKYAVRALRHEEVQLLMRKKLVTFDLVIAEWFYSRLLAPLAEVFECPLVWYSSVDAFWMNLQLVHESPSPAYAVDLQARTMASEIPDVKERAYRIWRQMYMAVWQYYFVYYIESPLYYEQYQLALQRRGRSPPLYEELIHSGAMLFINSHPTLGQNLPLPTSAKYIGGHHLGATEPLTRELQEILDNSKNGVIYVNLGATINAAMTQEIAKDLLNMFRQLEQDIIWKYSDNLEHVPSNVHAVHWAPQQSILKHPNTTMIISHGGYLTYIEAMFYGVALVGVPVAGDQLLTIDLAVNRGRGIKVDYSEQLAYHLRDAVNEILRNYSYTSSAREASSILRHRLVPPSQELRYWVDLVMSTGGAVHLRSPALALNTVERYYLDLIVLLCLVYWFLTKVVKLVKVYWDDYGIDSVSEKEKNE